MRHLIWISVAIVTGIAGYAVGHTVKQNEPLQITSQTSTLEVLQARKDNRKVTFLGEEITPTKIKHIEAKDNCNCPEKRKVGKNVTETSDSQNPYKSQEVWSDEDEAEMDGLVHDAQESGEYAE